MWDTESDQRIITRNIGDYIVKIEFSPNNNNIVLYRLFNAQSILQIFDIKTGLCIRNYPASKAVDLAHSDKSSNQLTISRNNLSKDLYTIKSETDATLKKDQIIRCAGQYPAYNADGNLLAKELRNNSSDNFINIYRRIRPNNSTVPQILLIGFAQRQHTESINPVLGMSELSTHS